MDLFYGHDERLRVGSRIDMDHLVYLLPNNSVIQRANCPCFRTLYLYCGPDFVLR